MALTTDLPNDGEETLPEMSEISVLIVDDDPVARKVLEKGLLKCGYDVTCVSNSRDALAIIEQGKVSLVLCDVVMPDMDGLQLLQKLRDTSTNLPVVMVSASEDMQMVYRAMRSGADDYITKPVQLSVLKNLWHNVLKKKREDDVLERLYLEMKKSTTLNAELETLRKKVEDLNCTIDKAVETPIAVISNTIKDLQQKANLTSEVQSALKTIVRSLESSDLYRPAINKILNNQDVDPTTKKWLQSEFGMTSTAATTQQQVEWNYEEDHDLETLRDVNFDAWVPNSNTLLTYLMMMFKDFQLLQTLNISEATLKKFLLEVRRHYHAQNPYHNFVHAFDVTQKTYSYLTKVGAAKFLGHIEICALLVACLLHDVEHPGLNNNFLIKTRHSLALRYNDKAVLENFHASYAFNILWMEGCEIFRNLSDEEYAFARKIIIECILATDLARHMEIVNRYKAVEFSKENPDHRLLLMQMIIKCADIANPTLTFKVAKDWAVIIQEEFFKQGDEERKLGMDISPFMDRQKPELGKMQIGFLNFFVIPLFTVMSELLPGFSECLNSALDNKETWARAESL